MLLNFPDLIAKYSLKITGLVQIGAHWGEETDTYLRMGIKPIVLIEPCGPAFNILTEKFGSHPDITLLNFACASYTGEASMFVETANGGQSNSLLKPAMHMRHYPNIKFRDTELVQVRPLDALPLPLCNTLVMDCQGGECQILTGARQVLQSIDYIYTEVNADNANLYEGAGGMTELCAILHEFAVVESSWVSNHGWGDACFIRKSVL